MKPLILSLAIALALSLPAPARAQGADIEATIGRQLEAFRADAFDDAFTFASPMIQGLFRTPETFGEMVRNGYPMVWRPASPFWDCSTASRCMCPSSTPRRPTGRAPCGGYSSCTASKASD